MRWGRRDPAQILRVRHYIDLIVVRQLWIGQWPEQEAMKLNGVTVSVQRPNDLPTFWGRDVLEFRGGL